MRNTSGFQAGVFLFLASVWGGSFVAIKFAIESVPPFSAALGRVAVATLALSALFFVRKERLLLPLSSAWKVWVIGLAAIGVPYSLLFWGEQLVSAGLAGVINGTVPLWTFFLGACFLRKLESFTRAKLIGLCVSVVGVGLVFRPALSFAGSHQEIPGLVALLGMSLSYSVSTLATRWLLATDPKVGFAANIFQQHCASLIFLAVLSYTFETPPTLGQWLGDTRALLAVTYLGIVSTAIGFYLYYRFIETWGAVRASTISYLIPVTSLVWDYAFFDQIPNSDEIAGTLVIIAGLVLLQLRSIRASILAKPHTAH